MCKKRRIASIAWSEKRSLAVDSQHELSIKNTSVLPIIRDTRRGQGGFFTPIKSGRLWGGFRKPTEDMPKDTKPVNEVRIGKIKAAIWRNSVENGVRYNTTFSRIYKDGDKWKSSDSFGRDDLPLVEKVAARAHAWIFDQAQPEGEQETKTEKPSELAGTKR